jgi:signal peptidase I
VPPSNPLSHIMNKQTLIRILALGLVALGWLLLAPPQLGGSTRYAIIYGTSMAPHFHGGDLVLIRARSDYRVGDVVAYRNGDLNRVVLHRILRIEGSHFVFKGDNNNFVDSYHATGADLLGQERVRLPRVGTVLGWAHRPFHAALIMGALGLLGTGGLRRRRDQENDVQNGEGTEGALLACGGAVALFALLAVVAFTHATTHTVASAGLYEQRGGFSYWAAVPQSIVYPKGTLRTGDTVYTKIVPSLPVRFDYGFGSKAAHGIAGTASLVAHVTGDNGFVRTLQLAPARTFSGDHVALEGELPLRALQALSAQAEQLTGVHADTLAITIEPAVHVSGIADGKTFHDQLTPKLALRLDQLRLLVDTTANATAEPFSYVQATAGTRSVASTIGVAKLRVGVAPARIAALMGLALALAGMGFLLKRRRRTQEQPVGAEARQAAFVLREGGIAYRYAPRPEIH